MLGALYARSLLLTPEEWHTLLGPSTAGSYRDLLKRAVNIPSLLERAKFLENQAGDYNSVVSDITNQLLCRFSELAEWRALQGTIYWVVPSTLENPADEKYEDKLFPFALKFNSFTVAAGWILCSTLMLHSLDAVLVLERLASLPLADNSARCISALQEDADKLARILCQCLEYCYDTENGIFGAQVTFGQQYVLRNYFKRRNRLREIEWCDNINAMRGDSSHCQVQMMAVGMFQ